MWFKQLSFYRLNGESLHETGKLSQALEKSPFQHCGGLDWFSEGWVAPARIWTARYSMYGTASCFPLNAKTRYCRQALSATLSN
jgi:DNA recombination-dependent growth factor C